MPRLTETFARKAPPSEAGTKKLWDTEVKGFALFVGKKAKTWYFQRDMGGRTQRVLIGRWPVISAAAARETAQELALEMARGAGKSIQIGAPKLENALAAYLARPKLRSEKHRSNVSANVHNHLGDWLGLPLSEITRAMVSTRHAELVDTPSLANHVFKDFRAIWNHARRTCDLPEAPTLAIEWYEEQPDGRIIEDLAEWGRAVDELSNPIHQAYYRLLLFTGLRKAEALTLRWEQIQDDRIHLPVTKNGRPFDLPITEIHHEILTPLRHMRRDWVFPSPKSVAGHLANPERLPWSPHAHRRTFATVAMEAGVLEEVVGRLLNHTPRSITGARYVRPSLDALRPAMRAACEEIDRRIRR